MKNWNPHDLKDSNTGERLGYVNEFTNFQLSLQKNLLKRFEELENKISIIIQGPLNHRSINTIPNYLNYGEVIVSCWDSDDTNILKPFEDRIKLVVNKYSEVEPFVFKSKTKNPMIYQNITTLNGLEKASGFLSIKVRSDESYPILDPLIEILKRNRDTKNESTGVYNWFKIVTSNIYFRKDREFKYHPSDHLIAGQTDRLKTVFEKTLNKCKKREVGRLTPEQLIATSAISSYYDPIEKKFDKPLLDNSIHLMKKHFNIIRIKDLPNSKWTSSYRKYDELSGEESWCHYIKDI